MICWVNALIGMIAWRLADRLGNRNKAEIERYLFQSDNRTFKKQGCNFKSKCIWAGSYVDRRWRNGKGQLSAEGKCSLGLDLG